MRVLLSQTSDGTLSRGILHWYTTQHVSLCPNCQKALAALRATLTALASLRTAPAIAGPALAPSDWARIEAAWDRIDGTT